MKQRNIDEFDNYSWRSGNGVRHINEVTLRRTRLVLGWATVFGLVCNIGM